MNHLLDRRLTIGDWRWTEERDCERRLLRDAIHFQEREVEAPSTQAAGSRQAVATLAARLPLPSLPFPSTSINFPNQ